MPNNPFDLFGLFSDPEKVSEVNPKQKNLPTPSKPPTSSAVPAVVPPKVKQTKSVSQKKVPTPVPPKRTEEPGVDYDPSERVREIRRILRKYQKEAKRLKGSSKPPDSPK